MERSDLELVLAVRDRGSLAAAAAAMEVVPSAITRRLAALEAQIGHRLFERTTRRVTPTAEGEMFCSHAASLLQGFQALEAGLRERHAEPVGRIRLAATFGFGRLWVGPAVADFQARHPGVDVQLHLTERLPDLESEGFDAAVWLWSPRARRAAGWTTRMLARNQRVLVAAPGYLAQHPAPAHPDELPQHQCLVVRENTGQEEPRADHWALQRERDRRSVQVRVEGRLSSNSGELARDWCLAGHGILLRSLWDVAPQIAEGRLVHVLPGWAGHDADIHWLAPHRTQLPRRLRLLLDFLALRFRGAPWKP